MPKQYPDAAYELCETLYLKFGGKAEAIQREMRRAGYAKWDKQLLYDQDPKFENDPNARLGWKTKLNLEKKLAIYLESKVENVLGDDQKLYRDIKTIRETLAHKAKNADASATDLQHFAKYADLELKARNLLDLSKANLETFAEAFELIGDWLREIDPKIAAAYAKYGEKLIEKAEIHYGKAEEKDDN